jgi:hypothetical protein
LSKNFQNEELIEKMIIGSKQYPIILKNNVKPNEADHSFRVKNRNESKKSCNKKKKKICTGVKIISFLACKN